MPPTGSGKTMTLLTALRMLPELEVSSVEGVHFLVPYAPYTVNPLYNITLGSSLSLPIIYPDCFVANMITL